MLMFWITIKAMQSSVCFTLLPNSNQIGNHRKSLSTRRSQLYGSKDFLGFAVWSMVLYLCPAAQNKMVFNYLIRQY